ncbi:hypothetical protein WN51_09862 [Melipona quadrifasciata]|uniref:Uncharacterized protein n=1 Tax=Melipona quadrifasciata TaxID=166423 RepID=A0A0N0BIE3_9HYME|nr:hypothetical protein WN51_09862 [Melipona quadrifasciata]
MKQSQVELFFQRIIDEYLLLARPSPAIASRKSRLFHAGYSTQLEQAVPLKGLNMGKLSLDKMKRRGWKRKIGNNNARRELENDYSPIFCSALFVNTRDKYQSALKRIRPLQEIKISSVVLVLNPRELSEKDRDCAPPIHDSFFSHQSEFKFVSLKRIDTVLGVIGYVSE